MRRLLLRAAESIILYGAKVWADDMRYEKYRKRLAAVQRREALRVACSYITRSRQIERGQALSAWKGSWMEDTRESWTAKLIGELSPWFHRRHGEVDYYLTQMLTGHGLFRSYLHKMGKVRDPQCSYCEDPKDDALHTFF